MATQHRVGIGKDVVTVSLGQGSGCGEIRHILIAAGCGMNRRWEGGESWEEEIVEIA